MTIWFASGNKNKKEELADILSEVISAPTWELKTPAETGLKFDPEETGSSFYENALIKAGALYRLLSSGGTHRRSGDIIIADDSGICVDALDGRPGIHSARYGGDKLLAEERNALLLAELEKSPQVKTYGRSARFVCAMILYFSPERFYSAQETLEGKLVENYESAKGSGGFGYDPILYIPSLGRTVAELSDEEKNRLSHRGKAARSIGRML